MTGMLNDPHLYFSQVDKLLLVKAGEIYVKSFFFLGQITMFTCKISFFGLTMFKSPFSRLKSSSVPY